MPNYRQISDTTVCLHCGKPIVEHHKTNRKKYHPKCKVIVDRMSNIATQRLRRSGIWISDPDKGITKALQKKLGI